MEGGFGALHVQWKVGKGLEQDRDRRSLCGFLYDPEQSEGIILYGHLRARPSDQMRPRACAAVQRSTRPGIVVHFVASSTPFSKVRLHGDPDAFLGFASS